MNGKTTRSGELRCPATLALLEIGGLHYAHPSSLTPGPDWLLLFAVVLLIVPAIVAHRCGRYDINQVRFITVALITIELIASLSLLNPDFRRIANRRNAVGCARRPVVQ
jgi:hypothetical protein